MKKIILGVVIGGILASSVPALANNIDVVFNKIKVTVNGNSVTADNVLINGRTYVPLRAISEMLNKDVTWDEKTSTAGVNDKDYLDTSKMPGYSRNNPADMNQKVNIKFKSGFDDKLNSIEYSANFTVKEIIRGDSAWELVKNANMFNKAPETGYDYLIAKIEFELLEGKQQLDLSPYDLRLISYDGKEYENTYTEPPEPKIYTKLYKGAKHEGYAVFQVSVKDSNPLITFGRDYKGNGGCWIKTF
jgi:hypothetical protein